MKLFLPIQIRRGDSTSEYVLLDGELGWADDTLELKVGDGTTPFVGLSAVNGGGGGGGAVASVFARTGAVTAQTGDYTKAQVGLGNVDNTSDVNKPVSTAQATADAASVTTAETFATNAVGAIPSGAAAGTPSLRALGSSSTTAAAGNDSRLSDSRTPTAHAATHASAGSDPVTVAQSQVTGLATALGLLAPLANPTLTGHVTVPTPTTGTDAVTKTYADGLVAGGAPDATTLAKGIVQLAGDLAGTAASPTVPGLTGKVPTTRALAGLDLSVDRTAATIKTALSLVKGDVGLGNVDNTSDATKNSATATLTNKTLTSPAITTPTGIVKADVGLGNVDNVADASKTFAASQITSGVFGIAHLATGTPTGSKFVRDDGTLAVPSGGSSAAQYGGIFPLTTSAIGFRATCDPFQIATTVSTVSGRALLAPIPLNAGEVVTNISADFGTAANGPTHWWFAITDANHLVVAKTADQTSTAIAASTIATVALTTPYTVPTSGLYFVAVMVVATTTNPNIRAVSLPTSVPSLAFNGATGLTTSPTVGADLSGTPASFATHPYTIVS